MHWPPAPAASLGRSTFSWSAPARPFGGGAVVREARSWSERARTRGRIGSPIHEIAKRVCLERRARAREVGQAGEQYVGATVNLWMAECATIRKKALLFVSCFTKTSEGVSNHGSGNEGKPSISEINAAVRVWMGKCPVIPEIKRAVVFHQGQFGLASSKNSILVRGLRKKKGIAITNSLIIRANVYYVLILCQACVNPFDPPSNPIRGVL